MQVKDIMTRHVEGVDAQANILTAAAKMKRLGISSLPVFECGELVGVFTERDIITRVIAESRSIIDTIVLDVMTPDVFYCMENDDISEAAKIMEHRGIHRLLVLNNQYELCGFLSLGDIAVKANDEHLTWEIVEKIAEPVYPLTKE